MKKWDRAVIVLTSSSEASVSWSRPSGDGDEFVSLLRALPKETAIIVSSAEIYRFGHIRGEALAEISAWTGLRTRLASQGQLEAPHVFNLAREDFTTGPGTGGGRYPIMSTPSVPRSEWPSDIESSNGIAILSSESQGLELATQQFVGLVRRAKDGSVPQEDWQKEIESIVQEPERRALLLSAFAVCLRPPISSLGRYWSLFTIV